VRTPLEKFQAVFLYYFCNMLSVEQVSFGYSKTHVLDNINFTVEQGENLAIIGESGSGKSTLLKLIYGEYDLEQGQIFWKDTEIKGPKYNLVIGYGFMKYVTQEFDLMPYTSVENNIGKYLSRFNLEKRQERINELIDVVELKTFAKRKVKTLSGGQKQRVALARALAKEPDILLLDEPFSHIDNFKKQSLRRSVFNYLKKNAITCIVATHDKHDVLGFADTMLVLHDRTILTTGSPQELYNNPKSGLVASFFDEFSIINDKIYYPHQLRITKDSGFKGVVKNSYFNGKTWLIAVEYDSRTLLIEHTTKINSGTEVHFKIRP
jgi:ABC-type Fe3+/spermidine/putrescine transport system ATPase subunit